MKNCFSKRFINTLSIVIIIVVVYSYNFLLHIKENNIDCPDLEINTVVLKEDNEKKQLENKRNSSEWRIVIPKINLDTRNKRRNRCRNFR